MLNDLKNNGINHRRITHARYEHGLSVSELGIMTGLSDEQIIELENGTKGTSFVENEHRIDCVRRVADVLGIKHTHFLAEIEYDVLDPERPDFKEHIAKSRGEEQVSELDVLNRNISKSGISRIHGSEAGSDDRIDGETKLNANLRSVSLFSPIMLIFLYTFFFILNFV